MSSVATAATPVCSICCETLGKYGGPVTLPCGHNACLHCISNVQRSKAECPLCRAPFSPSQQLVVNTELRELVFLAAALGTVEQDGWQNVTSNKGATEQDIELLQEGRDVQLVPSAPPIHVSLSAVRDGHGDLLSLEPPSWLPDSHAVACGRCKAPFQALRRSRHHCRLCGQIFCHACSHRFLLLPPRFQQPQPQRTCTACATLLEPLQPFLAGTITRAVQPAVHDVTDGSAARSWLNIPLSSSLDADLYKATNIARSFTSVGQLGPERSVPASVLRGAAGFALLSTVKVGMGWSGTLGTGLVVARRGDGSWSPPSSLLMVGMGWGFQVGGALSDLLIVLRTPAAVQAFCGTVQAGVGGGVSLAVGPLGRQADAALRVGRSGAAVICSYCITRGAFAGVSIEGTVMRARDSVNRDFYGRPVAARQLLLGESPSAPLAARPLYAALDDLMACVGGMFRTRAASCSHPAALLATDELSASDAAMEATLMQYSTYQRHQQYVPTPPHMTASHRSMAADSEARYDDEDEEGAGTFGAMFAE